MGGADGSYHTSSPVQNFQTCKTHFEIPEIENFFFSGSDLLGSFFWSSNFLGSFLWSSNLVKGLKVWWSGPITFEKIAMYLH